MQLTAQTITHEEQERIHQQSLQILQEVGIRFHGERAPQILRQHGIPIDPEDKIAKIPPEVVAGALATTPTRVHAGGAQPGLPAWAADAVLALLHRWHGGVRGGF